jgi:hypothetical protein
MMPHVWKQRVVQAAGGASSGQYRQRVGQALPRKQQLATAVLTKLGASQHLAPRDKPTNP